MIARYGEGPTSSAFRWSPRWALRSSCTASGATARPAGSTSGLPHALDALRRGGAHVAGGHLVVAAYCRAISSGRSSTHAGRGEDLGPRPSHCQRRSRFDHAVRSILAWAVYRPDHAQAPHRSRRAADPGRRTPQRRHRTGGRDPGSISCSASSSIPSWSGYRFSARQAYRSSSNVDPERNPAADRARHPLPQGRRSRSSRSRPYHAHTARLLDAHCDLIPVARVFGMVMHGLETTGAGHART